MKRVDSGLQHERTQLSWRRVLLSRTVLPAIFVRVASAREALVFGVIVGFSALVVVAAVWRNVERTIYIGEHCNEFEIAQVNVTRGAVSLTISILITAFGLAMCWELFTRVKIGRA